MTLNTMLTGMMATIGSKIHCPVIKAITASVAPSAREPVNSWAGCTLYHKKPNIAPRKAETSQEGLSLQQGNVLRKFKSRCRDQTRPPSSPSVKLTALDMPTIQNTAIGMYQMPKPISPFSPGQYMCGTSR